MSVCCCHCAYTNIDHCFLFFAYSSRLTEDGVEAVHDAKRLKFSVDNTLKTVFGVMGASASEFDILAVQRTSKAEPTTALLRVRRRCVLSHYRMQSVDRMCMRVQALTRSCHFLYFLSAD